MCVCVCVRVRVCVCELVSSRSQGLSVARIHDKQKLKSFWEQRIQQHSLLERAEHSRERDSALLRLATSQ